MTNLFNNYYLKFMDTELESLEQLEDELEEDSDIDIDELEEELEDEDELC